MPEAARATQIIIQGNSSLEELRHELLKGCDGICFPLNTMNLKVPISHRVTIVTTISLHRVGHPVYIVGTYPAA
jgi:hypothetical protein